MDDQFQPIRELVDRVRSRWRRLIAYRAMARVSVVAAAVLATALLVVQLAPDVPFVLAALGLSGLAGVLSAAVWGLRPAFHRPSDARVARFIEERAPELDDRLASAVDIAARPSEEDRPLLALSMMLDAARAAEGVSPHRVIAPGLLRRARLYAVAAVLLLAGVGFGGRHPARRSLDALALVLSPSPLAREAGPAEVAPAVSARPPRVTRIDLEYFFPRSLGLPPRVEEDGGDIYAPVGTDVRLTVHTDGPAWSGQLLLDGGEVAALTGGGGNTLAGSLRVARDGSYRIGVADPAGVVARGDTEYFIRTVTDQPPEVRLLKPASDRSVTRLDEVDIEAEAEDDYGIQGMDLVYAVRGGAEEVVPISIPARAALVTGRHTMYLEDLDVSPGDFITYYVRARDLARGKRPSEARSDIFFLEVRPFEQEFSLAPSQAAIGGGSSRQLDDLVAAQKEIIVATWKLDRRPTGGSAARSADDIRSVGRAESELKTRVEASSSAFRESAMRDPRRRAPQPGRGTPPPASSRPGQTLPEEDAMTLAAAAMGRAVAALEALKTSEALPPEMEALSQLLIAQADVKKRQVQRQQAGSGGGNRATRDLSGLFDKELARQQQTSYETPRGGGRQEDDQSALEKIKDLARRQDELLRRQQDLARKREQMSLEALKRELEKLTREQEELRKQAEDLSERLSNQQSRAREQSAGEQSGPRQLGQPTPGQQGSGSGRGDESGRRMREISEDMRRAARDLGRQDASQASARSARALDKLRDLEQRLQATSADARRRALGDLQLEARQLADRQRQVASDLRRTGQGEPARDSLRRLAGDEDRLADDLRRLQEGLKRQADLAPSGVAGEVAAEKLRQTAADASNDLDRRRLLERMRQAAAEMRSAAGGDAKTGAESSATPQGASISKGADAQQEIARALDGLADRLAAADDSGDEASRRLAGQRRRAQELQQRLDELTREIERLEREAAANGSQASPSAASRSDGARRRPDAGTQDLARLREDMNRQMREVGQLLDQLRREDADYARSGPGFTFEGQGMVLSAPGTEAWKQDFSRWQQMKQQATQALERAESALFRRIKERDARIRLAVGAEDRAPTDYQQRVDSYFKALATKKQNP
jgi:hypothetical protein